IDPPAYAQGAREKAQRALRALGFLGWKPKQDSVAFHSLFGFQPNPLQRLVIDRFPNVTGPTLTIVEALMGQGKTEAAMWLVDRATHTLGQGGCYFALPTRATSNQMFDRVRAFLARRYPADIVNLQLLHGSASLSDQFDELKREHFRLYEATNVDGDEDRGSPAGVVASQWFTHSKQGLLAPFGVGTVDQALLAILQTKHVFVRLFGLSHKTVIIDEVHAYDTYMSTLLEQLLRWLGALDTSVILLSATLPEARRVRLLRAYEKGLGIEESRTLPPSRYPRVTWTSKSSGLQAESVPQGDSHRVWIRWIEGASTDSGTRIIGEALQQALAGGGNAAVICNTVDRAQKMYSALKDFFPGIATDAEPELDLLHARFPFEARDAREKRALRRYGKPPKPDAGGAPPNPRPHRSVLVATQVIEQSLDLDFDLLVTDMAPADLILQRVGRLHRHERGPRPTGSVPYVWIMAPEVAENGTPRYSQWTDTVYDEHILLRSWLALRDRETLSLPEDVEALVERVYGDQSCPPTLLPAIQHLWNVSEAEMKLALQKDADQAENRDVKPPWYDGPLWKIVEMPLAEDSPEVHRAHQA
ncbi:MAG: CRISPR-associated helicase Cas3', partial [Chloroflexota bacterium]